MDTSATNRRSDADAPVDAAVAPAMNTTPLIDIMLVMLIMFIITIPIQTHAVKVDLPAASRTIVHRDTNRVTIAADGTIGWNGEAVDLATLGALLTEAKALPVEPELQIDAHPQARFVVVDNVLATVKRREVASLGFVGNERYARVF